MLESVYYYLKEFGFNDKEIDFFEDENEDMFSTNNIEIEKNINFLFDKGLEHEEVLDVIRRNPDMLTVKNNRLEAYDKIFNNELDMDNDKIFNNELDMDNDMIKKLILSYPDTYVESPIDLQNIINYLKEKKYDKEYIRNLIIDNPKIISMDLSEFEKEIILK